MLLGEWKTINNMSSLIRYVSWERSVQPKNEHVSLDEYVSWMHRGLVIHVYQVDQSWICSYQTIKILDQFWLLLGVGVHETYRKQGYGNFLVNHCIKNHLSLDIVAETRYDNEIMHHLMTKYGFIHNGDVEKNKIKWKIWRRPSEDIKI